MPHHRIHTQMEIYGIRNQTEFAEMIAIQLEQLRMPSAHVWPEPVTAYVSDGRWVADCPFDNGGIGCSPDNPSGFDFGCGTIVQVVFPSGATAAENILLARPRMQNRHWLPQRGESVSALRKENLLHGYPLERGD